MPQYNGMPGQGAAEAVVGEGTLIEAGQEEIGQGDSLRLMESAR